MPPSYDLHGHPSGPSTGPAPSPFHCEQTPVSILCWSPCPQHLIDPSLSPCLKPGCPQGKGPFTSFSSGSAPGPLLTSGAIFSRNLPECFPWALLSLEFYLLLCLSHSPDQGLLEDSDCVFLP